MRYTAAAIVLLSILSDALANHFPLRRSFKDPATAAPAHAAPRRFIIELNSRSQESTIVEKIANLPGLRVVKQFDSDIFPGVAVECEHSCSDASLRAVLDDSDDGPVVASVYQSTVMQLLPTVRGESFSDDAAAANYSVHGMTGVEKLHQAGVFGDGATVAIVDSGVQYTHPAVGSLP